MTSGLNYCHWKAQNGPDKRFRLLGSRLLDLNFHQMPRRCELFVPFDLGFLFFIITYRYRNKFLESIESILSVRPSVYLFMLSLKVLLQVFKLFEHSILDKILTCVIHLITVKIQNFIKLEFRAPSILGLTSMGVVSCAPRRICFLYITSNYNTNFRLGVCKDGV